MPGRTIDVSQIIERQRLGSSDVWLIVLSFWIVLAWDFGNGIMSQALPDIIARLSLSRPEILQLFLSNTFGFALGAIAFGYVGDQVGRRPMIVASCLVAGIFSWLVIGAANPIQLKIVRVLAGFGMGGLLANVVALNIESAPRRFRVAVVTIIFAAVAIAELLLTPAMSSLVSIRGWQILFHIAGIGLILTAVAATLLPESLRFLAIKGGEQVEIAQRLTRIEPQAAIGPDAEFVVGGGEPSERPSLNRLFSGGLGAITPLLWLVLAATFVGYTFLSAWLSVPVARAGLSRESIGDTNILLQVGGATGALAISWTIDRFGMAAITLLLALAVPFVGAIGFIDPQSSAPLLRGAVFLAGCCTFGAILALHAVPGDLYPTSVRATGIGFTLGIGRIGLLVGPLFGVALLNPEAPTQLLFLVATIPFFIAAVTSFVLMRLHAARTGADATRFWA